MYFQNQSKVTAACYSPVYVYMHITMVFCNLHCIYTVCAIRVPEHYSINLQYIIYYFTLFYRSIHIFRHYIILQLALIIIQLALYIAALLLCRFRVLDDLQYHKLADETLEELGQFFEDLGDTGLCPSDYDVSLAVSLPALLSKGLIHTWLMHACVCVLLIVSSVPLPVLVRMESWQFMLEVNLGVMSSTSRALTSKCGCHPQQGEEEGDYWIWTTLCAALCKGQFLLSAVVQSGMMSSGVGGGIHMMALLYMTCSAVNSRNSWIARLTCLTWSILTLSMMVIHGHSHVYLDNAVTSTYIA